MSRDAVTDSTGRLHSCRDTSPCSLPVLPENVSAFPFPARPTCLPSAGLPAEAARRIPSSPSIPGCRLRRHLSQYQKNWREANPDYQRQYRQQRPESQQQNRERQHTRDAKRRRRRNVLEKNTPALDLKPAVSAVLPIGPTAAHLEKEHPGFDASSSATRLSRSTPLQPSS